MDMNKEEKGVSKTGLDTSNANLGVWLVKVPQYVSSQWKNCPGGFLAGNLDITRYLLYFSVNYFNSCGCQLIIFSFSAQGQKPQLKLTLSEDLMGLQQERGEEPIPKEHNLVAGMSNTRNLGVISKQKSKYNSHKVSIPYNKSHIIHYSGPAASDDSRVVEKIMLEGKVLHSLNCQPLGNTNKLL